jgi:hypothetical protein
VDEQGALACQLVETMQATREVGQLEGRERLAYREAGQLTVLGGPRQLDGKTPLELVDSHEEAPLLAKRL